MSNYKTEHDRSSIINLIIRKEIIEELERWTQTSSKKIREEAKTHLNKIKTGKSTFLLGILCPLLWWALLTKQGSAIILMCIIHSVLYIIWGISSMKKGYISLLNVKEGL